MSILLNSPTKYQVASGKRQYIETQKQIALVAARHGLPPLIARLLLNRGLAEPEAILAYLEPQLNRLTPFGVLSEIKRK